MSSPYHVLYLFWRRLSQTSLFFVSDLFRQDDFTLSWVTYRLAMVLSCFKASGILSGDGSSVTPVEITHTNSVGAQIKRAADLCLSGLKQRFDVMLQTSEINKTALAPCGPNQAIKNSKMVHALVWVVKHWRNWWGSHWRVLLSHTLTLNQR